MKTKQTIWFPDLEAAIALARNVAISQERLQILEPLIWNHSIVCLRTD